MNLTKAPITTAQGIGAQVARGQLGGMEPFGGVGKLVAQDAINKKIIWPNGDFNIPVQATGETISFVSSSAQDAAAGTGVKTIRVQYLDTDLVPQTVDIALAGTTPVTGQLSGVRFIQDMHALSVGDDKWAAGDIEAYRAADSAVVFSVIPAEGTTCASSARMVPKGKQALMLGAAVSSSSGLLGADVLIDIVATGISGEVYTEDGIWFEYGSIGVQDTTIGYNFPVPLVFPEGTIIALRATKGATDATIIGDWFGWIEDAGV